MCAESDVSALGGHAEMGLKKGYMRTSKNNDLDKAKPCLARATGSLL